MIIAFTICSNNYLAHAKTLGDTFLEHHPDIKFIIGLVDKYDADFDYSGFSNFEIIPVEELAISCFEELHKKYNIVELNTAVKPAYFHYIFAKYYADKVMYIDPDVLVLSRFEELLTLMDEKNIVITPHITIPIDDEFTPTDYHTLRGGVFNLGFIGLSQYEKVTSFLDWWHQRVIKYGFSNFAQSMFYDQLWINYVPALYDNYAILKHLGYNMANWNFHERFISGNVKKGFTVNEKYSLRFFHFSGYDFKKPAIMSCHLNRYDFETRPDLKPVFDIYQKKLIDNNVETIKALGVYYYPNLGAKPVTVKRSLIKRIVNRFKRL